MANHRAAFSQSDLTKVYKACRDAGQPMPEIIIEPERMTIRPMVARPDQSYSSPNDFDLK